MAQPKETQVTVSFGSEQVSGLPRLNMVFEIPNQVVWNNTWTLHLFPAVPATLETSHDGSCSLGNSYLKTISKEYLRFDGTDRVATEYYAGTTIANIGLVPAKDRVTETYRWFNFYDVNGKEITKEVTFQYDTGTGEVVASQPIYGLITVSYSTTYRKVYYSPKIARTSTLWFSIQYDTILAFYEGAVATYQFEISRSTDKLNREIVIEVYSELVIDQSGSWEKPDDWPDMENGQKYNGRPGYGVPDPSAYLTTKRVHHYVEAEVGGLNRLFERKVSAIVLEQPFTGRIPVGNNWFKPVYEISVTEPADADDDLKLDIQKKATELRKLYEID